MMGLRLATEEEKEFRLYAINTMREARKRIDGIIKVDRDNMRNEYGDGPGDRQYTVLSVRGPSRQKAYLRKVMDSLDQESWRRFGAPTFVVVG